MSHRAARSSDRLATEKGCICIPSLQEVNKSIRVTRVDRPAPRPVLDGWERIAIQSYLERTSIEHGLGHIAFCGAP
eukprot:9062851-Pyramimonas_sp.AAC.1